MLHWTCNWYSSPSIPRRTRNRSCRSFSCPTLNAVISPGSIMKPLETAVLFVAPSPNQRRSLRKNPLGMPIREIRVAGAIPFWIAKTAIDSHALRRREKIFWGGKEGGGGTPRGGMADHCHYKIGDAGRHFVGA